MHLASTIFAITLLLAAAGTAAAQPPDQPSPQQPAQGGLFNNMGNSLDKLFSGGEGKGGNANALTGGKEVDTSKAHGVHDLLCQRGIVDPFEITDNMLGALGSAAGGGLGAIGRLFSGGGSAASAGDEALKAGKRAARNMNWLPMALERRLGDKLHSEEEKLIPRESKSKADQRAYAAADELLATLLPLIPAPHPYDFRLFVVRDNSFNAKAIPGGYLYVNLGVLAYKGEKGKAKQDLVERGLFVLAHELAHVLKRHQTREVQTRVVDTIDTMEKLKDLVKPGGPNPDLVMGAAAYMKKLHDSYSPDQEKQSDACALRLMTPVGLAVASRAFDAFAADLPDAVNVEGSLHPVKAERMSHGRRAMVDIQANATPGQGWQIAPAAGKQ